MKNRSAISRMWRCAAVLVVLVGVSGCTNYGTYTGSTSYGGGDEHGVSIYRTIYSSLNETDAEAVLHCKKYKKTARRLNCGGFLVNSCTYVCDEQSAGLHEPPTAKNAPSTEDSDQTVCNGALAPGFPLMWDAGQFSRKSVSEARRRGFSPGTCAERVGRTDVAKAVSEKPKLAKRFAKTAVKSPSNLTANLETLKRTNACRNCYLQYADLREADLRKANLQGADLWGANLLVADLRSADLQVADLRRANLGGADLRKADLQYANLQGADLRGANLLVADLRGAKLDSDGLAIARASGAIGLDPSGSDVAKAVPEKPKPAKRVAKTPPPSKGESFALPECEGSPKTGYPSEVRSWNNCKGTFTYPGGNKYVGEWKDGSKHGHATYYYLADNRFKGDKYVGEYKNGKKHGQGTFTWEHGDKYVGEFNDGAINGQGTYTYADGRKYDGEWKSKHKSGNGQGTYSRPKWHGQGTLTYADGRVEEGIWENNKFLYAKKITPLSKPKPAKRIAKAPPPTKPSLPTAKARDTTPPTIRIASAITVKSDSPTIKGRASDNTQVAQVTVEGVAVDLNSDGSFTFSRYVPLGGTQVTIEAVDEWGNKAQKVVRLSRKAVQTAALSFGQLNPTKIKGRSNENAIALVIGVANYSRAPAATFADNDANVFSDYAHRAFGIPRSNIKVLVNDKATLTDLKVSVKRWLRGRIDEGKTDVHVFFAGHGLASPDGKDLYLLPYGGETSLLDETALLRRELFEVIGKAKPKSATIFLDTCYSGLSRGKETLLASARGIVITPKPQSIPSGFTVLSAASGQQISSGLDEAKHGLFSYYLMKGMEGGADANKDRKITASELHAYLGSRVKRQAIRLGREQTPELSGDGERVLVRW